jgi:uncharacterized protein (TIGR02001 family)
MKQVAKKSLVLGSLMGATMLASSAAMAGGLSANVGMVTDYFFRGIDQGTGATGSAGLDYDFGNGLAVGTWGADVGDGMEIDLYGSYSGEVKDFSYSVGVTTYNYTGEFDDTYKEINLGVGYGPVSLAYAKGKYETDPDTLDYTFVSATLEQSGAHLTYGKFGSDFEGSYVELGYNMDVGGFDTGITLINSNKDLSNTVDKNGKPNSDMSMVFSLGKSFDL